MFPPLARWFSFAILCTFSLTSMAQDAPPIDASKLLESLQKLEQQNEEATEEGAESLENLFRKSAGNFGAARDLYYQCRRVLDFEGEGRESMKFREWEDKFEADMEKSDREQEFAALLNLHLRYLVLSLRRARLQEDPEAVAALMPELKAFAEEIAASSTQYEGRGRGEVGRVFQELWERPISASPFLRAQNAGNFVGEIEAWEPVVSNYQGMFEKVLLPYWRKNRDTQAIAYWEMRLAILEQRLAEIELAVEKQRLAGIARPELHWNKAKEYTLIGQPNRGVLAMFEVVRANPNHPEFEDWVTEIRNLLQPKPAQTEGTAATASP